MNEKLTFGGVSSDTFETYISGEGTFNTPARVYQMVDVPGKNGQLAIDEGRFENILVEYPAFIVSDLKNNLDSLKSSFYSMKGYQRLEDDYHPEIYRLGIFKEAMEVAPAQYNNVAQFSLVFDCKPQRFLISGETQQTLTSGDVITNPTPFPARPLFEADGEGELVVGNITITISDDSVKFIDCEIMEAYSESGGVISSENDNIELTEFPTLEGNTTISWTGLTSVKMTPRWWKI